MSQSKCAERSAVAIPTYVRCNRIACNILNTIPFRLDIPLPIIQSLNDRYRDPFHAPLRSKVGEPSSTLR